ncbi:hypothetical protein UFOVP399_24 [uncultured Caudovirales phage]|uniref:Uncharacterized protein n=1 Tax=uncultured Caudovirales phage TaxID=2100421 RepID=A0A6J5M702_9CAUD|nr:hypothetical protein UFOVP399_24 [uncultured Caudovirales phage]
MEPETTDQYTTASLSIIERILDSAGAAPVEGVTAQTLILATLSVPILMQVLSIVRPHINTHAMDKQETIRLEAMRQLVELRKETSPEEFADAMMAMDAGRAPALPAPPKKK